MTDSKTNEWNQCSLQIFRAILFEFNIRFKPRLSLFRPINILGKKKFQSHNNFNKHISETFSKHLTHAWLYCTVKKVSPFYHGWEDPWPTYLYKSSNIKLNFRTKSPFLKISLQNFSLINLLQLYTLLTFSSQIFFPTSANNLNKN